MKKALLIIIPGGLAVLFVLGWFRAAKLVDAGLGAGEWAKAKLSFKLQAALANMLP